MIEKKIGRYISIAMGFTMSFTMSLIGSLFGTIRGGHFSVPAWLMSFAVSFVIASIIALALGFIVPMKKVNDGIEKATKTKGFVLHLLQSLASDIMYTVIISFVMAFVSTALFSLPGAERGMNAQIEGMNAELMATEGQIANLKALEDAGEISAHDTADLRALEGKAESLKGEIAGVEQAKAHLSLVPMAIGNWVGSFILEFLIALVVIMIVEPIFQKQAFKKYIPNYGE